jgi:hypothetical protein
MGRRELRRGTKREMTRNEKKTNRGVKLAIAIAWN